MVLKTEPVCLKITGQEVDELPKPASRLRRIFSRAGWVYLSLFLGLSLLLSVCGFDPLLQQALLPKGLLIFVGLALILALGSAETNLLAEYTHSRLVLYRLQQPQKLLRGHREK
ncbi:MAG: hypothetical protein L6R45_25110 [Anaerolineae bacterium]|nr:hypothetical protein [Anaerolineae bacterium]